MYTPFAQLQEDLIAALYKNDVKLFDAHITKALATAAPTQALAKESLTNEPTQATSTAATTEAAVDFLTRFARSEHCMHALQWCLYSESTASNDGLDATRVFLNTFLPLAKFNVQQAACITLRKACQSHRGAAVAALLLDERWCLHIDPSMHDNDLLVRAVKSDQADVVRVLLRDPRVNACARDNECLLEACKHPQADTLDALLTTGSGTRIDLATVWEGGYNSPLKTAVAHTSPRVVARLLGDARFDPSATALKAVWGSFTIDHDDVAKACNLMSRLEVLALLFEDARVRAAVSASRKINLTKADAQAFRRAYDTCMSVYLGCVFAPQEPQPPSCDV
jgi:hypothetical protein